MLVVEKPIIDRKAVRTLMIQQDKTLKSFASSIGYDEGWISRIVNNRTKTYNPQIISDLACYLNVEITDITN